jgi:hypothetical protein
MRPAFVATASEVALSAATAAVVLRVNAASDRPVAIDRLRVSFNGIDATDEPALVQLVRLSDNGTMTAVTPAKLNDSLAEAIGATAAKKNSAEPTTGDVLATWYVHPQTGLIEPFSPDCRPMIGGGDRVGVEITAPDAVDCCVEIWGLE